MPVQSERPSNKEFGLPAENYVYDFLYHDARRIASFLSQLGQYGALGSVKHTVGSSEQSKTSAGQSASGGVPSVGSAAMTGNQETADQASVGLEKTFDPLWVNALDFFEKLDEYGLLIRDLSKARIGQFVLAKGSLSVVDVKFVQQAYKLPQFRVAAGITAQESPKVDHGKRRSERKISTGSNVNPVEFALELLEILPHGMHARLNGETGSIWCGLREDSMTVSSADILLKTGVHLAGQWSILGILDAGAEDETPPVEDMEAEIAANGAVPAIVALMAPVIRQMLGRPTGYYGLTPLMVFREVSPSPK